MQKKNCVFSPGLLGILHTGNDSYIDENNNRQVIEGSGGFTLNATTFLQYAANKKTVWGICRYSFDSESRTTRRAYEEICDGS